MTERWLPISGYEGFYEVSDHGRVRGLDRIDAAGRKWSGKILVQSVTNRHGHRAVNLHRDASGNLCRVHRLVLETFVGPCPPGLIALHRNDNPSDNRLPNLRWGTVSDNARDSVRNGNHFGAKKTECPKGHAYDASNTYRSPKSGKRRCRICQRTNAARRIAERRSQRSAS